MVLFFFCAVFSYPMLVLFLNGGHFDNIGNALKQYMGIYSLGNLGMSMDMTCASSSLPDTFNQAAYISFRCPQGMKVSNLQQFGLAYHNETCTGFGVNKEVQTIHKCSLGSMDQDLQMEFNIEKAFADSCVDKRVCSMYINYAEQFTKECLDELWNRQHGETMFGPAKVYAIALCEATGIAINENITLTRDQVSYVIIAFDCLILFVVTVSIIRLRWYEKVSVLDMKNGKLRLEDFSVYMPEVAINKKDYNNNPDLLTA